MHMNKFFDGAESHDGKTEYFKKETVGCERIDSIENHEVQTLKEFGIDTIDKLAEMSMEDMVNVRPIGYDRMIELQAKAKNSLDTDDTLIADSADMDNYHTAMFDVNPNKEEIINLELDENQELTSREERILAHELSIDLTDELTEEPTDSSNSSGVDEVSINTIMDQDREKREETELSKRSTRSSKYGLNDVTIGPGDSEITAKMSTSEKKLIREDAENAEDIWDIAERRLDSFDRNSIKESAKYIEPTPEYKKQFELDVRNLINSTESLKEEIRSWKNTIEDRKKNYTGRDKNEILGREIWSLAFLESELKDREDINNENEVTEIIGKEHLGLKKVEMDKSQNKKSFEVFEDELYPEAPSAKDQDTLHNWIASHDIDELEKEVLDLEADILIYRESSMSVSSKISSIREAMWEIEEIKNAIAKHNEYLESVNIKDSQVDKNVDIHEDDDISVEDMELLGYDQIDYGKTDKLVSEEEVTEETESNELKKRIEFSAKFSEDQLYEALKNGELTPQDLKFEDFATLSKRNSDRMLANTQLLERYTIALARAHADISLLDDKVKDHVKLSLDDLLRDADYDPQLKNILADLQYMEALDWSLKNKDIIQENQIIVDIDDSEVNKSEESHNEEVIGQLGAQDTQKAFTDVRDKFGSELVDDAIEVQEEGLDLSEDQKYALPGQKKGNVSNKIQEILNNDIEVSYEDDDTDEAVVGTKIDSKSSIIKEMPIWEDIDGDEEYDDTEIVSKKESVDKKISDNLDKLEKGKELFGGFNSSELQLRADNVRTRLANYRALYDSGTISKEKFVDAKMVILSEIEEIINKIA